MAARNAALRWFGNASCARPLRPVALPRVGRRSRRVEAPALRAVELDRSAGDPGEGHCGGRRKARLFRLHSSGLDRLAGALIAAGMDADYPALGLSRSLVGAVQRLSPADLSRSFPERNEPWGSFLLSLQHAPLS